MNNRVFRIQEDVLVLKRTGKIIPETMPVFILIAPDKYALSTIRAYQSTMPPTSEGWKIIQNVIDDFTKFRRENPKQMGEPNEVY